MSAPLTSIREAHAPFEQMRRALGAWVDLPEAQWREISGLFNLKRLDARAHLALPGSHTHELCFIYQGLVRVYYTTEDGKETNKAFISEGMFAGPLAASTLGLPLYFGIQALEPTTYLSADYQAYRALFDQHPVFDRLGRQLAEWLLIRKELRERSLLQLGAKQRYLDFMEQHPQLHHRVALYHIASYLGITEVTLSRLRGELANTAKNAE